jgi:YndJ-like protein
VIAASVGTLLWLYLVFSGPPGMLQGTAELAVLAAPLIAIPLSLEASSAWTKRSASVCAAGVVGAYYLAPGFASGMFALPWVLFAALTFVQLTLREDVLSRAIRALSDPREIPLLLELCAHAYLIVGVVSAVVLALSLAAYAWVMSTRILRAVDETSSRILLRISSACLFFTMTAACIYTVGHYFHRELISITTMIRIHGMINAGGFAILGLIGFAIEARTRKTA